MDNLSRNLRSNRGFGGLLKGLFIKSSVKYEYMKADNAQDYVDAIKATCQELKDIEQLFNYTSDPDLIDYVIYERNAVNKRFSYLLKKAKENNIKCSEFLSL